MIRIVAAASGAWFLAGAILLLPGMASVAPMSPTAPTGAMTMAPTAPMAPTDAMTTVPIAATGATAPASAMTVNSLAKGDRLDVRSYGPGCSDRGWPYYEASCIRNTNAANRDAKPVRIIAIDHLPPGFELATSR
jgi:endonuclease YncB( thermonuclease family)